MKTAIPLWMVVSYQLFQNRDSVPGINWIYDENKLSRTLHHFQISCIWSDSKIMYDCNGVSNSYSTESATFLLLSTPVEYNIPLIFILWPKSITALPCMTFSSYILTVNPHPDSVGSCIFRMLFLLNAIARPLFHISFMQNLLRS